MCRGVAKASQNSEVACFPGRLEYFFKKYPSGSLSCCSGGSNFPSTDYPDGHGNRRPAVASSRGARQEITSACTLRIFFCNRNFALKTPQHIERCQGRRQTKSPLEGGFDWPLNPSQRWLTSLGGSGKGSWSPTTIPLSSVGIPDELKVALHFCVTLLADPTKCCHYLQKVTVHLRTTSTPVIV